MPCNLFPQRNSKSWENVALADDRFWNKSPLPRFSFWLKIFLFVRVWWLLWDMQRGSASSPPDQQLGLQDRLRLCFPNTQWEKYCEGLAPVPAPHLFFLFFFFLSPFFPKLTHYVPPISHTRFLAGHGLPCLNPTNLHLADCKIPLAAGLPCLVCIPTSFSLLWFIFVLLQLRVYGDFCCVLLYELAVLAAIVAHMYTLVGLIFYVLDMSRNYNCNPNHARRQSFLRKS